MTVISSNNFSEERAEDFLYSPAYRFGITWGGVNNKQTKKLLTPHWIQSRLK